MISFILENGCPRGSLDNEICDGKMGFIRRRMGRCRGKHENIGSYMLQSLSNFPQPSIKLKRKKKKKGKRFLCVAQPTRNYTDPKWTKQ